MLLLEALQFSSSETNPVLKGIETIIIQLADKL